MKVTLANGRILGFNNHYTLGKFLLFGKDNLNIAIADKPHLKMTKEVKKLMQMKRKINFNRALAADKPWHD